MEPIENVSKPFEISKELENINFKELLEQFPELKTSNKDIRKIAKHKKARKWFFNKKVNPEKKKNDRGPKSQLVAFQQAMTPLLIAGQCLGLNPIAGTLEPDVSKMRFSVFNWRFLYSFTLAVVLTIGTILMLNKLSTITLSIRAVGFCIFHIVTCITTFSFMHLGTKWPGLMKELATASLNEYIDPSMKYKCYISCTVIFILAFVEHALSLLASLTRITDCHPNVDLFYTYQRRTFAIWYDLGLPVSNVFGITMQIMTLIFTFIWNYSDVFILCISFYLVSIQELVNKKIIWASQKHFLPSNVWRSLREDYCKTTRLVRSFDDVTNGILFISFANNLFFICLQLFNVLNRALGSKNLECQNFGSGIFGGREFTVYVVYSTVYLLGRSLTVSLIAAGVHSASMVPATALYNVPSSSFCPEVARFLNQVHTNTVALSGLKFFYVTRELVLSVAGTIVTYELVVLQVSGDENSQ